MNDIILFSGDSDEAEAPHNKYSYYQFSGASEEFDVVLIIDQVIHFATEIR